jgi:hypothetical protein
MRGNDSSVGENVVCLVRMSAWANTPHFVQRRYKSLTVSWAYLSLQIALASENTLRSQNLDPEDNSLLISCTPEHGYVESKDSTGSGAGKDLIATLRCRSH